MDFDPAPRRQAFLNLDLGGARYFFSATEIRRDRDWVEVSIPTVVFRAERRDRPRHQLGESWVRVQFSSGEVARGRQVDASADGFRIEFVSGVTAQQGEPVLVDFSGLDGRCQEHAEIRHLAGPSGPGSWRRLGVLVTHGPRASGLHVERRASVPPVLRAACATEFSGRRSRRVEYLNAKGEVIRGILDVAGKASQGIVVLIPPAWGRTKESTVALSETILGTFGAIGESVSVLRFDGIRKRGESHNDPECQPPTGENLNYRFSQGVRDIHASLSFLDRDLGLSDAPVFIVSLSIASVEARRAIVEDRGRRIKGWISLVGAVDPQSMIRVVSGGIDFFAGGEQSVRFGKQYIQGLLLDVDAAVSDAIETRLAFLDDARRDMARMSVPLTWIAGTDDAWTSRDRLIDMLSVGDGQHRKLIELPIGHQLRTSKQALEAFELTASELARMALGRNVPSVQPSRRALVERRREEQRRGITDQVDLREFWKEYLVGRDGRLGIELMTATSSYRSLMAQQVQALGLRAGSRVLDVGSGAGAFPLALLERSVLDSVSVVELDLVVEGLKRARLRLRGSGRRSSPMYVAADVDARTNLARIPLNDRTIDAALLSLVVNYVSDPAALLAEVARVLRPGGALVLSGMREDADVSKICVDGVGELRSHSAAVPWSEREIDSIDQPLQEFISAGARILDLEEFGPFRFMSSDELREILDPGEFLPGSVEPSYGDPPQAWVLTATRKGSAAT